MLLGLVLVVAALPTVETAEENFKWAVLAVGDDSVVFRVVVSDDVTIGEDVIVQGPASETEDPNQLTLTIPGGVVIPDGGVVVTDMAIHPTGSTLQHPSEDAGFQHRLR
jgi:hypothetical protein